MSSQHAGAHRPRMALAEVASLVVYRRRASLHVQEVCGVTVCGRSQAPVEELIWRAPLCGDAAQLT